MNLHQTHQFLRELPGADDDGQSADSGHACRGEPLHEDLWGAVNGLALMATGNPAKPVVPAMLKAVAQTAEPLQPIVWEDPIQLTHGELAAALFQGLLRDSTVGVDPDLLYPAIRAISRNADGMARATLRDILENRLSVEDVQALGPDILVAVKTRCPADTMFGNEIRMGGFKALTKYHFQEGIEASVIFAKTQGGHGSESRTGEIMKELMRRNVRLKDFGNPSVRRRQELFRNGLGMPLQAIP